MAKAKKLDRPEPEPIDAATSKAPDFRWVAIAGCDESNPITRAEEILAEWFDELPAYWVKVAEEGGYRVFPTPGGYEFRWPAEFWTDPYTRLPTPKRTGEGEDEEGRKYVQFGNRRYDRPTDDAELAASVLRDAFPKLREALREGNARMTAVFMSFIVGAAEKAPKDEREVVMPNGWVLQLGPTDAAVLRELLQEGTVRPEGTAARRKQIAFRLRRALGPIGWTVRGSSRLRLEQLADDSSAGESPGYTDP